MAAPSTPWRTTPPARRPTATGRYYVTQTSALHFLRNQATGTVRASAWVRHRGKSTVLTAVDITGEGGRLLATGEFTFFCVDKALMDQKAAAEQK